MVGIGVLPIGDGRLGIGASMTLTGLRRAVGPTTSPALLGIVAGTPPEVLARVLGEHSGLEVTAPDVAAMSDEEVLGHLVDPIEPEIVVFDAGGPDRASKKAIAASGGDLTADDFPELSPELVVQLDLSQASRIPDAFSGLMSVVAVVVVTMLVASGGRQRRQELAVLRTIGFGRREVRRTIVTQAITTVLAASLLVPVGVALGRAAWLGYASSQGVVPEASVVPQHLAGALGVLLVVAVAVAVITARLQGRRPLATLLEPRVGVYAAWRLATTCSRRSRKLGQPPWWSSRSDSRSKPVWSTVRSVLSPRVSNVTTRSVSKLEPSGIVKVDR